MIGSTCVTCHATSVDVEYIWALTWADQHMQRSSRCFNPEVQDQFSFKVIQSVTS